MPRLNVSMLTGKSDAYRTAILDNLYRAMRETLGVPEDDQFITLTEHTATNFRFGSAYGINRSPDLVYIQITVFDTRTREQKQALYRRIVELLGDSPGLRPEDVFINVYDAPAENWSVGGGVAWSG